MRRFNLFLIASMVLLITSCGEIKTKNKSVNTVVEEDIPVVTAVKVHKENIAQTVLYPTIIEAEIVNNIAPQTSARIKDIFVEVGDHVKAGQRLANMDDANLEKARLQVVNDSLEYGRTKELYEIGASSQSDFDLITLSYSVSRKSYDNLLENTRLNSPINGIVTARNYDKDDMYSMAEPIFVVQQIKPVKMLINIPESKFTQIKKGMKVDITSEVYDDVVFEGKINLIYPTIDPNTHTFTVEVIVENKDERLRPGMFARVSVNYGDAHNLVIPDRALQKQIGAGDQYVYVLNNDNTVTFTNVEVGRRLGDKYEILRGLNDGDIVVTTGQSKLRNGITVEVK